MAKIAIYKKYLKAAVHTGEDLLAPLLRRFYCIPLLVISLCDLNSCCIIAPLLHSPLVTGLGEGGCGHQQLCCKQNVRGKISPDLEVEI